MGNVPVEDIGEGTLVLTNAEMDTYGVASDEEVTAELVDCRLIGFNGEDVFATEGHIFHTTTGLRALNQLVALQENAWRDVGMLEVGHVLQRLRADGKGYELVPIESVKRETVARQVIHGVHLREGDRSYHANGYRVAVNYPEVTIKSVAAALAKLPPAARLEMLLRIDDLRPHTLLEESGVPTTAPVETKVDQVEEQIAATLVSLAGIIGAVPEFMRSSNKAEWLHTTSNWAFDRSSGIPPVRQVAMRGLLFVPGSDAGKAASILVLLKMWTGAVATMLDAWRDFRLAKVGNQAGLRLMDELFRTNVGTKGSRSLILHFNQAAGGGTMKTLREHVNAANARSDRLLSQNDRNKVWRENWRARVNAAADLPSGATRQLRFFNMSLRALQTLGHALAIAGFVVLCFNVANQWDTYTDLGKALAVVEAVFVAVEVAVEMVALTGVLAGCWVLPIVGIVAALIGIILGILFSVLDTTEPPFNAMEEFVDKKARPFLRELPPAPNLRLVYTLVAETWTKGRQAVLHIRASNNTLHNIKLKGAKVTFLGGLDDACLFNENDMDFNGSTTPAPGQFALLKKGVTDLEPALVKTGYGEDTTYDVLARGVSDDDMLVVKPLGYIDFIAKGTVHGVASDLDGESVVTVVETHPNGDSTRKKYVIQRKN